MYKFTLTLLLWFWCNLTINASTCSATTGLERRLGCYDTLSQCSSLDSDAKRLACYESRDARQAETERKTRNQTPVQASGQTTHTIETHISNTRLNRSQVLHIYLDNGQVWKEITRSRFRYKKGQNVSISFTPLGAARLHAEGMKKYAKVSQVK